MFPFLDSLYPRSSFMGSSLLAPSKTLVFSSPPSSLISTHSSAFKLPILKKCSFKICALSQKWEPSKVITQADRVLIRLEELPEVLSVGDDVTEVEPGKKVLFSDTNAY